MGTEKSISCPKCSTFFFRKKLRKLRHPKGIMLDVCDNCGGMWVDGNELSIISGLNKGEKKWKKRRA